LLMGQACEMKMMSCNDRRQSGGSCDCQKTMKTLRALDFAIQETVLYLDAYPENRQALEYYHRLMDARRETMELYEKSCGPVTMYGNTDKSRWGWIDSPWPWEAEANR